MTAQNHILEQKLLEGYREQLRFYNEAVAIVELADGPTATKDWPHDLHSILGEVAALDASMADDKAAWGEQDHPPDGDLSTLVDQVARRLARLAQNINSHVALLQERREKLLPEIDEFIQRRRMLEAYGKYGDRQPHVA